MGSVMQQNYAFFFLAVTHIPATAAAAIATTNVIVGAAPVFGESLAPLALPFALPLPAVAAPLAST